MERKFKEGQAVILHSLGPSHGDKEYRGIIRGVATSDNLIYIVQMIDSLSDEYPYSHCTMPASCIRLYKTLHV